MEMQKLWILSIPGVCRCWFSDVFNCQKAKVGGVGLLESMEIVSNSSSGFFNYLGLWGNWCSGTHPMRKVRDSGLPKSKRTCKRFRIGNITNSFLKLVGGLEHFLCFHILGIIIPID